MRFEGLGGRLFSVKPFRSDFANRWLLFNPLS